MYQKPKTQAQRHTLLLHSPCSPGAILLWDWPAQSGEQPAARCEAAAPWSDYPSLPGLVGEGAHFKDLPSMSQMLTLGPSPRQPVVNGCWEAGADLQCSPVANSSPTSTWGCLPFWGQEAQSTVWSGILRSSAIFIVEITGLTTYTDPKSQICATKGLGM